LPLNGVIRDTDGGRVVAMYWYFWLFMAEIFEGCFKNHPFLAIEK
jgi:hypothetical protein